MARRRLLADAEGTSDVHARRSSDCTRPSAAIEPARVNKGKGGCVLAVAGKAYSVIQEYIEESAGRTKVVGMSYLESCFQKKNVK
jgi:hypothetical protein